MDMEVAVCYGPHDVRLEREPLEALGPGDVRVRVAYCGVCPWDRRVYSGRSSSARYPLHLTTPLLHAAFTEPLACIVRAQNRLARPSGSTALAQGCGPLGLLHAQLLRHRGVRGLAADPLPSRREAALSLDVDAALDPSAPDFDAVVAEQRDGQRLSGHAELCQALAPAERVLQLLDQEVEHAVFAEEGIGDVHGGSG